jgi:hypothetical protein
MIVLSTTPTDSMNWSRKLTCTSENGWNEPSSITASTSSSKKTGRMITWPTEAWPMPDTTRT